MSITQTAENGANTVLGWIAKYGLPTVFAVILLVYVLWQGVQMQAAMAEQSRALWQISQTQAETVRALERIEQRIGQTTR